MTPEPNDRMPLDFTRPLELVCDGTELVLARTKPDREGHYESMRRDLRLFTADQHPSGHEAGRLWFDRYGCGVLDPSGPQIVCNRVEEGCANCHGALGDLADGREPEELCDTCYSHATATPAAPEPDGEVECRDPSDTLLSDMLNDLYRRRDSLTPAEWQEAAPILLGIALALTPPPASSATPAEGMIGPIKGEGFVSSGPCAGGFAAILVGDQRFTAAEVLAALSPATIRQEAMEEAENTGDGMSDLADHLGHEAASGLGDGGKSNIRRATEDKQTRRLLGSAIRAKSGSAGNVG